MKCDCPFLSVFDGPENCVYYQEGEGSCDGIEVNPGNGDAWCYTMVELGVELETKRTGEHKPLQNIEEYGRCPRCGSLETVCHLIDSRTSFGEYGKAEDWHIASVCSDCGKEFEIIDGYP